jgi:beta-1,4-mannosyl-glycoprotein beta-1,4-N-acetylglucosaminyltransferase
MRVIDCFLYNGEIEILKLRLTILYEYVDFFHIVESKYSFTGNKKHVLLKDYIDAEFTEFKDKIHYTLIEDLVSDNPWDNEHFLRRQLVECITLNDDDIIIFSDVDEIINFSTIKNKIDLQKINIIELDCFYYFFNVRSNEKFYYTLVSKWCCLKSHDLGDRSTFNDFDNSIVIRSVRGDNGGHFTYQFGYDYSKYELKISSFSHQEFNNEHYLNEKRIINIIKLNKDLYGREKFYYTTIRLSKLFPAVKQLLQSEPYKKMIKYDGILLMLKIKIMTLQNPSYWKSKKSELKAYINQLIKI